MKTISGFTLVEVLVAVTIFTVVMIFGLSFFTRGQESLVRAKETNYALQIARDRLEELKATPYGGVPTGTQDETKTHPGTGINYTRSTTVGETLNPTLRHKDVRVRVAWTSAMNGIAQDVALNTVLGYTGSTSW